MWLHLKAVSGSSFVSDKNNTASLLTHLAVMVWRWYRTASNQLDFCAKIKKALSVQYVPNLPLLFII